MKVEKLLERPVRKDILERMGRLEEAVALVKERKAVRFVGSTGLCYQAVPSRS